MFICFHTAIPLDEFPVFICSGIRRRSFADLATDTDQSVFICSGIPAMRLFGIYTFVSCEKQNLIPCSVYLFFVKKKGYFSEKLYFLLYFTKKYPESTNSVTHPTFFFTCCFGKCPSPKSPCLLSQHSQSSISRQI